VVLEGLAAAKAAGLAVKVNAVALRGVNEEELDDLVAWTGEEGFDLVFIEVMPMGDIGGENRLDQYLPLALVRARLQRRWTLDESDYRTGGPARYVTVRETGRRLGFITPLTHNFCESCNRVRLTCTGTLYMCLGQEDAADLRTPLRQSESDEPLDAAIREAISRKPKGHDFIIDRRHNRPAIARHMSVPGGWPPRPKAGRRRGSHSWPPRRRRRSQRCRHRRRVPPRLPPQRPRLASRAA